jgi:hypothetical protein
MITGNREVWHMRLIMQGGYGENEKWVGAYLFLYTERSLHDEFLLAYLGLSTTTAPFTLVIVDVLALALSSIRRLISLSILMNCVKAVMMWGDMIGIMC